MEKFALFIIGLFKHPIKWCGADYEQVITILKIKLAMDFRQNTSKDNSPGRSFNSLRAQLCINLFFGIFIAIGFITINNLMLNLTICFSMAMVWIGFTIITGYSSVLFDHRDNQILLFRPISNRSLLIARLLHIQVYLGLTATAICLFASIAIVFKYNVFNFIAFWVAVGLCSWITLLLTSFFYMALSFVVSGERFKDMITYMQILMTMLIFGSYQFLPRMFGNDTLNNITMEIYWWTYLVPPAWLAGFVDLFSSKVVTFEVIMLALIAIFVAIAGAIVMIRYLSGGYVAVLSGGAAEKVEKEDKIVKNLSRYSIYRLFCVSEIEQLGWKLAMSITRRDRKFKQAVYPSYGIIIVMAIIFMKPDFSSFAATIQKLSEDKNFYLFLFLGFFGTSAIGHLPYSDTPEGAWIYRALPIKDHGHILVGAIKAMFFKFFCPVILVLFALTLAIWGVSKIPGFVMGCLLIVLNTQCTVILFKMSLPFTQARAMIQGGEAMAKMMVSLIGLGLSIGLVYLVMKLDVWVATGICLFLLLMIFIANCRIRKRRYI